jgi:acyl-CoA synthetase (AMP-forming)/AMP-acid ligase II
MTLADNANIALGLTEMARDRPHSLAVLAPAGRDRAGRAKHVHWTFRQLDIESDCIASGLRVAGIGRGVRTVLMVKPSLNFFALTFGLFKAGAVPVLVDPGLGIKNLGPCLAEAEPEAFIGIPAAQVARKLLGWGKSTIRRSITINPLWPAGRLDFDRQEALACGLDPEIEAVGPDQTAAILFTSGSTGVPKGAVYTHAIFQAQVDLLRSTYQIEPGEVDLCTFPLFALFGPILGMICVVPEMDSTRPGQVDPRKIIEAIDDFGVTNLFGSPALIRRVGEYGAANDLKLPSLRRVISAGAPVPARVLDTFSKLLNPDVEIFTPYGATESLPVASIGSNEILGETRHATDRGEGVCVGRAVEGMRVELIKIQDEPIATWSDDLLVPEGEPGEIVVQGPVVTRSYFNRNEATALAKIEDPANGGFWHRMGDLGRRDESGRIWFLGRKSHRVQTPDGTLFTIAVEGIFNTHPEVARTALVGVNDNDKTKPILCVETKPTVKAVDWKRIETELLALGQTNPITREIDTFLVHPSFPVDIRHNAKIFREKLAIWAEKAIR